jgi:hypothetical protein
MIHRMLVTVAAAALALPCVSCNGTAEGLSEVTGKVMCNGQPAAGAVLVFHRQAGTEAPPASAAAVIPSATAQEDGSFRVESHPLGFGAAPGKYTVLVRWPDEPTAESGSKSSKTTKIKGKTVVLTKNDKGIGEGHDRLEGRYMDSSKSLLQFEVKPGPNDLGTLELEMKKQMH